jgi:hypothetical protein
MLDVSSETEPLTRSSSATRWTKGQCALRCKIIALLWQFGTQFV